MNEKVKEAWNEIENILKDKDEKITNLKNELKVSSNNLNRNKIEFEIFYKKLKTFRKIKSLIEIVTSKSFSKMSKDLKCDYQKLEFKEKNLNIEWARKKIKDKEYVFTGNQILDSFFVKLNNAKQKEKI